MICVAEDDLRPDFAQMLRRDRLHCALRPHGHEDGCLDCSVPGLQPTSARRGRCVGLEELEVFGHHEGWSLRARLDGAAIPSVPMDCFVTALPAMTECVPARLTLPSVREL